MIISEDIYVKILSFHDHDFMKSLSNHCMISCLLNVNFIESTTNSRDHMSVPIPLKYTWNDKSLLSFQQALLIPSVASKLDQLVNNEQFKCNLDRERV